MRVDREAADLITKAQKMISVVKGKFPKHVPSECSWTVPLTKDGVVCLLLFLLGRKIPRAARAGRIQEAEEMLNFAEGLFLGTGAISRHEISLITDHPFVHTMQAQRWPRPTCS